MSEQPSPLPARPWVGSSSPARPADSTGKRRDKATLQAAGQPQKKRGQDSVYAFWWNERQAWYYRAITFVTLEDGKLKRVMGTALTQEQAEARARENRDRLLAKMGKLPAAVVPPKRAPAAKVTTGAPLFRDVAEQWLKYRSTVQAQYDKRKPISPQVKGQYRLTIKNHLDPQFGDRPIDTITRDELKDFRDVVLPTKQTERGLMEASHRRGIEGVLRQIFAWAFDEKRWLTVNPAAGLHSTPKDAVETRRRNEKRGLGKKTFVPRAIVDYLTPDVTLEEFTFYDKNRPETKQEAYDAYLHHVVYEVRWMMASMTAMRPAEVRGLTWDKFIYLNDKQGRTPVVRVTQQLDRDTSRDLSRWGTKLYLKDTTKTASGDRTLPLPEPLVDALKRYKKVQDGWKRADAWNPYEHLSALVFTTPTGKPRRQQEDNEEFIDLKRRVFFTEKDTKNIADLRLYDLRHLAITGWIRDGKATAMEAQKAAGHANISTTISTYTHLEVEDITPSITGHSDRVMEQRKKRLSNDAN